jgi:hypothetical protein
MKQLIFLMCLLAYPLSISAQNRVHLRQSGRDSFYTSLEAAYNRAQDGDTIYLPGGSFAFPNNIMAKRLAVIGAGINQDSSKATGVSAIRSTVIVNTASQSNFTGVYFNTSVSK